MHLADMWHLAVSPLSLILRTVGVYFAMLVGFRIFGKRELGQATIFDVAMVLLIANAVQNAMVGPDTSLLGGIIVAAVLLLLNSLIAYLQVHDRWFRYALEGRPTVLISRGRWYDKALHEEGLDRGEVYAAMRETGVVDASHVRLAVLEANGNITVVPADAKTHDVARGGGHGGGRRTGPRRGPGLGPGNGSGGGPGSGPGDRSGNGPGDGPGSGPADGHGTGSVGGGGTGDGGATSGPDQTRDGRGDGNGPA